MSFQLDLSSENNWTVSSEAKECWQKFLVRDFLLPAFHMVIYMNEIQNFKTRLPRTLFLISHPFFFKKKAKQK